MNDDEHAITGGVLDIDDAILVAKARSAASELVNMNLHRAKSCEMEDHIDACHECLRTVVKAIDTLKAYL